jgi:hypothetical protein
MKPGAVAKGTDQYVAQLLTTVLLSHQLPAFRDLLGRQAGRQAHSGDVRFTASIDDHLTWMSEKQLCTRSRGIGDACSRKGTASLTMSAQSEY